MKYRVFCIVSFFVFLITLSCTGGKMEEKDIKLAIYSVSQTSRENLGAMRIFFGHQSVGYNIVEGIAGILSQNPNIPIVIKETRDAKAFGSPLFAHAPVGKNENPQSKSEDFSEIIISGVGEKADIAFFKFCYVDVHRRTDIDRLLENYKKTMVDLKQKYPQLTLVHVTVPLTTVQTGPKAVIKRVLGRPLGGYEDNMKRYEFNRRLKSEVVDKDPLFDLAEIESTLPDGKRSTFKVGDKVYYQLAPQYSDDGGHLNTLGKRIAADRLLVFLAGLADKKVASKR